MEKRSSQSGFTLIEMLVVIGISALLTVVAIGYSKVGKNETALAVETSKIAELILQAKELALTTYGLSSNGALYDCAYGVHFDYAAQTYSLFAYSVSNGTRCPSAASTTVAGLTVNTTEEYQSGSWQIPIAQGVEMDGGPTDALYDVLFYPPNPTTLISVNGGDTSQENANGFTANFMQNPAPSKIYLTTVDGQNSAVVSVSPEGQVTF